MPVNRSECYDVSCDDGAGFGCWSGAGDPIEHHPTVEAAIEAAVALGYLVDGDRFLCRPCARYHDCEQRGACDWDRWDTIGVDGTRIYRRFCHHCGRTETASGLPNRGVSVIAAAEAILRDAARGR